MTLNPSVHRSAIVTAEVRDPDTTSIKPMFVVGGLYSLANGVAWIMRDLAAALGRAGAPVDVYAADCWGRGAASIGHVFEPPTRWVSSKGLWLGGLSWSPALKSIIRQAVGEHDVVHNHSLWMLPNSYSSQAARRAGKPVVITAHGALEPWAVQNSGWKKKLVGRAFQDRDLQQATCLQVNSHTEIDGLRAYGLTNPVAVIPNGICLEDFTDLPSPEVFYDAFPETRHRRLLLFMARLHRKKGLEHLLQAWANASRRFSDWHLVIAGPDSGFGANVQSLIASTNLASRVTLTGNLQGDLKRSVLAATELFVQPSFSEGFSMSIVEALACGIPVLMTPGCNFPEAARAGAAIEVEPHSECTERGLHQLLSLSESARADMGQRGRMLIEQHYTWTLVARNTLRLYSWLQNGGPTPGFVVDYGG